MEFSEESMDYYMNICIDLARNTPYGIGRPHVGALVLSPNGEIIGKGHKNFLEGTGMVLHAERVALEKAGNDAGGGSLITTLEPCSRISMNQVFSSCSELIVERGITEVFYGMQDIFSKSLKAGSGINYLLGKGIDVQRYDISKKLKEEGLIDSLESFIR